MRPLCLNMSSLLRRATSAIKYWSGLRVASPELESGADEGVTTFYSRRVTDCRFLSDPGNYEHPRADWILDKVNGGRLIEIGCGNGGMTRLLASRSDQVLALDISAVSLKEVEDLELTNVTTVHALVEHYEPGQFFDWIVLSEVLEHLRQPQKVVRRCLSWLLPGGSLLVTTPNGHWESDEHLQEFNIESFAKLMVGSGAEMVTLGFLRDRDNRRRWLVAELTAPTHEASEDQFHHRLATARKRRQRV